LGFQAPKGAKESFVEARFDKTIEVKAVVSFADGDQAEQQKNQWDTLTKAGAMLAPLRQVLGGQEAALEPVLRELVKIKADRDGSQLIYRVSVDLDGLAPTITAKVSQEAALQYENAAKENLKLLASAFVSYHKEHGHYPQAVYKAKDGTELYSWR